MYIYITNVTSFEYLGILIDNKLKMNMQINTNFKKVSTKLDTFALMRTFLTRKTSLLLYKVIILPHFDYVDFIADSATYSVLTI